LAMDAAGCYIGNSFCLNVSPTVTHPLDTFDSFYFDSHVTKRHYAPANSIAFSNMSHELHAIWSYPNRNSFLASPSVIEQQQISQLSSSRRYYHSLASLASSIYYSCPKHSSLQFALTLVIIIKHSSPTSSSSRIITALFISLAVSSSHRRRRKKKGCRLFVLSSCFRFVSISIITTPYRASSSAHTLSY